MRQEEDYKERMNRLLDDRHFAYDETTWNSTRRYIDAMNKKRRRALAAWWLAGMLLLGTGALYLLMPANAGTEKVLATTTTKPAQAVPVQRPTPGAAVETPPAITAAAPLLPQPVKSRKMPATPAQEPAPVEQKLLSKQKKIVLPESGQNNAAQKPGEQTHDSTTSMVNVTKPGNPNSPSASPVPSPAVTTEAATEGTPAPPSEIAGITPSQNTEQPPIPLPINTSLQPTTAASVVDSLPEKEVLQPESLQPAIASFTTPADSARLLPFSYLALEAGLGFSPRAGNAPLTDGRTLNPTAGVSLNKYLTHNVLLSLGIAYNRVAGLQPSTITSRHILYGYGEESAVTAVTPAQLHYLTLPLRAGWQFRPGHSLWAACNISYLFNAEARVEKYNQVLNRTEGYTSYISGGYTEGFRIFDTQLALLYRARIKKELWLQAEFAYGLNDVKENGFFKSQGFERNNAMRLTLVYGFLQLK